MKKMESRTGKITRRNKLNCKKNWTRISRTWKVTLLLKRKRRRRK